MFALLGSGNVHSRPVVYMYLTSCTLSCMLNGWWFSQILGTAIRGKKSRAPVPKKLD